MRTLAEQFLQDIRFGARILRTSPGLSATAIVLIALVIGGNITIYSMVRTLLTRPAPGVEADRLVVLSMTIDGRTAEPSYSYPDYLDFVAQSTTAQPLIFAGSSLFTLTLESGSFAVRGSTVRPTTSTRLASAWRVDVPSPTRRAAWTRQAWWPSSAIACGTNTFAAPKTSSAVRSP